MKRQAVNEVLDKMDQALEDMAAKLDELKQESAKLRALKPVGKTEPEETPRGT